MSRQNALAGLCGTLSVIASPRPLLARLRKASGYTQEGLAEALHVDRMTVYRWEAGQHQPQPYLWPKLAALLHTSRTELTAIFNDSVPVISTPSTPSQPAAETWRAPAGRFDHDTLTHLRQQLGQYMNADGNAGPTAVLPNVLALLQAVEHYAPDVTPGVRQELLTYGAQCAEFAGWLCRDSKRLSQAVYWYDRAMEWAQETGDFGMQGYMLLKKSQMAYDGRDAARVAALAKAAQYSPWTLPAKV